MPGLPPSSPVVAMSVPWMAATVSDRGVAHSLGGVLLRGGSTYDKPHPLRVSPPPDEVDPQYPPVGVVVGAGAVGALTGHLVFHSLLISVGLGIGAMGVAASSDGHAGELARSSGRIALAAFERTVQVNERYHLTDRLAEGIQAAGRELREFDREHAVVHKATEGAKKAWQDLRKFDETHQLTSRAGNAVGSGLDKLAQVLEPPKISTSPSSTKSGGDVRSSGSVGDTGAEWNNRKSPADGQTNRRRSSRSSEPPGRGLDGGGERGADWWGEEDAGWKW